MNQNGTFATQASSTVTMPDAHISETRFLEIRCRAQVLVLDSANGPADLVMSVAERLYERHLCLLSIDQIADIQSLSLHGTFHLAVIGIACAKVQEAFALLDCLSRSYPVLPVIVITDTLTTLKLADSERLSHYPVVEVLPLPHHAAQLRVFMFDVLARYLPH